MKKIIFLIGLAVLGGGLLFTACKKGDDSAGSKASAQADKFHCPMHPTYTSNKPGDCPICGMRLVPISQGEHEEAPHAEGAHDKEREPLYYRHPMNPDITSPIPKPDEMGMDYVPVYEEVAEMSNAQEAGSLPDRAPVKLSIEREQLIGVRTASVQKKYLENIIRASGRIAYDPDLYNAIVEYREALTANEKVKESPWPEVRERSEALIRASVLRLRQMGLSQSQIDKISHGGEDPTNLLISQKGGSVWVYGQIYEYEAGQVKAGQTMEVTTPAFPGQTFQGKVVAVDTILNPETRTLKVRGEIPAQGGQLKPEMFVEVKIHVRLGLALAVPEEAVLNTGDRKILFVKKAAGQYEPREAKIGRKAEDYFEVLSGVKEGDEVVISANFLIDSESKLKAALSGAGSGGGHAH